MAERKPWSKAATIAGGFTAIIGAAGIMVAGLDAAGFRPALISEVRAIDQTVQQVAVNVSLLRFQYLEEKQKRGGLTPAERREFCALARQLGFREAGCA